MSLLVWDSRRERRSCWMSRDCFDASQYRHVLQLIVSDVDVRELL